ncbi:MAG: hypothetical protein AB1429_02890 [Pseudomonadota bacterium]|jgi:hypothetical protein
MQGPSSTRLDRVHALVLVLGAALIAAYWAAYFLTDWTKPDFVHDPAMARQTAVYLGFEGAFPLPDAFVAVCLLLAGLNLSAGRSAAVAFGLVGAGGLMFLALIDIFFNITQGLYAPALLAHDLGMQMEVVINLACLLGAIWTIKRMWGHPLRFSRDQVE